MAPYDHHQQYHHHSPSSVLDSPTWLLDSTSVIYVSDTPLDRRPPPCPPLQQQASPPTSGLRPNQQRNASSSTSSFSSKGASAARVKKRKSRAKPKPPIKELSASPSNFRDIVHQFTGSHSRKSATSFHNDCVPIATQINSGAAHDLTSFLPMLHQYSSGLLSQNDAMIAGACIAQSLKTLETISAYLLKPLYTTQVHEENPKDMNKDSEGDNMTRGDHQLQYPSYCNMHNIELLDKSAIQQQASELEQLLLKGNGKTDNFFSLSCLVLNQLASQWGILQRLR